jgi:hypothetical protein
MLNLNLLCPKKSQKFRKCYLSMMAVGLLSTASNQVLSQESGVKIALALTPSAPETTNSTTENQKAEPKPDSTGAKKKSPFALSSFEMTGLKARSDGETAPPSKEQGEAESAKKPLELKINQEVDGAATRKAKSTDESSIKSSRTASGQSKSASRKPVPGLNVAPNLPKGVKPLKLGHIAPNSDDNEDAECPGGSETDNGLLKLPEDIPLEQEAHPYDAPVADLNAKPDRPTPVVHKAQTFTSEQLKLRNDINRCLQHFLQNPETIARRSPWAVMHAILPFGVEAELVGGNRRVNAIGWMCYNGMCKTQRIFQPTQAGFRTNLGPGVQGHEGQFLAILAQSKVAADYPLKVGNRSYTINDLVRYEMATCKNNSELTFKLIGLSYYLDQNQQWKDNEGGTWNLEKMVGQELDQPIVGAACGGTHRLMGLTFSLMQHKQAGLPVDGHWYRSEQYLNDFVQYTFTLQNADGSFSTEWFEGRGSDPNVEKKVQTTGHILEWLIYTLPDDQLDSPQVVKALRFLLGSIGANPSRDWPIGPRGHSLRALALYDQRVFGAPVGNMKKYLASLRQENSLR